MKYKYILIILFILATSSSGCINSGDTNLNSTDVIQNVIQKYDGYNSISYTEYITVNNTPDGRIKYWYAAPSSIKIVTYGNNNEVMTKIVSDDKFLYIDQKNAPNIVKITLDSIAKSQSIDTSSIAKTLLNLKGNDIYNLSVAQNGTYILTGYLTTLTIDPNTFEIIDESNIQTMIYRRYKSLVINKPIPSNIFNATEYSTNPDVVDVTTYEYSSYSDAAAKIGLRFHEPINISGYTLTNIKANENQIVAIYTGKDNLHGYSIGITRPESRYVPQKNQNQIDVKIKNGLGIGEFHESFSTIEWYYNNQLNFIAGTIGKEDGVKILESMYPDPVDAGSSTNNTTI